MASDVELLLATWKSAIELFNAKLAKDDKKKIDIRKAPKPSFQQLYDAAVAIKDKVGTSRHTWSEILRRILRQINQHAVVGDTLVQFNAEYTSLA